MRRTIATIAVMVSALCGGAALTAQTPARTAGDGVTVTEIGTENETGPVTEIGTMVESGTVTENESVTEIGGVTKIGGVTVSRAFLERSGDYLRVGMELDLSGLDMKTNLAVLLTPHIVVAGADSLDLPSIGIYGRQRHYFYLRGGKGMLTEGEESYKWKDRPDTVKYSRVIEFPEWAGDGPVQMHLRRSDYGCCNALLGQWDGPVAQADGLNAPAVEIPAEVPAVHPPAVRERSLSGSAYIDYAVDKTDIREGFHHNSAELSKIRASIDSVRDYSGVTITKIHLKGFASPEGSYSHNAELAEGRTKAVKDYVANLYDLADSVFVMDFEPEDWEGLREFVESSDLKHRAEILGIIDGDLEPDAKEARIRSNYPAEYRFLLAKVYPSLRRTDYRIHYIIREYTETDEIRPAAEGGDVDQIDQ